MVKKASSNNNVAPKRRRAKRAKPKNNGVTQKQTKARQVGESVKQLENDIRFSERRVNTSEANQLANQLKEVIFEQSVTSASFLGPVIAYISIALQKGYMANATSENYPYFALCYITQMILSSVQNGVPLTTTAPLWLTILMQSLSSKSVTMANGKGAYRFKLDNPAYTPPSSVVLSVPGYSWWVWEPSTSSYVDGFPIGSDASQNPPYTLELGQDAWTSITEFMSSSSTLLGGVKENKMVPTTIKTNFQRDVSAFAVNNVQCGVGYNGSGAPLTNVQLEVPILHPQFSVFTGLNVLYPATFRYPSFVTASGGDSIFLGGFLSSLASKSNYGMKRAPKFHFVDFNEFADTIAWWLTGALQAYVNSPTFQTSAVGVLNFTQYQCPLTFQEFLIVLRNVLMGVFKDTQPSVQGLMPHSFQTGVDQQFIPFTAGSNTCFLSDCGGMNLPMPVIENLRALTFRYLFHKGTVNNPKDLEMWIPVLGAYNDFNLDYTAYTVTYDPPNGESSSFTVFPSSSYNVKRTKLKTSKGISVKDEAIVEPLIELWGGSAFVNGVTVPVFLNDPNRLGALLDFYNNWVKQYIVTFSCSIGIYSTDAGPSSLCALNMTRYSYGYSQETKRKVADKHHSTKLDSDIEIVDTRYESKKSLGKLLNDPYQNVGYATTSATNTIMSAPYSGVLDVWILPQVNAETYEGSISYDTPFQRWQSGMREVYSTVDTSGNSIITYANKHRIYASKMYNSITTPADDWMMLIETLLKTGQGGILTSTIAGMIPGTAGAICSAIANLLPI